MDNNSCQTEYNEVIRVIKGFSLESWIAPSAESVMMRLEKIKQIGTVIDSSFTVLKQLMEKRSIRTEYCKSSDLAPRGYYCPDPLFDIIASNCRRGRITKRKQSSPCFTYYFDSDNELIMIENDSFDDKDLCGVELLFRYDSFRIGFYCVEGIQKKALEATFRICVECKDVQKGIYTIGEYSLSKVADDYFTAPAIFSREIFSIDGIPRKVLRIQEIIDLDSGISAVLNDEGYSITSREFEIKYDDSGLPIECVSNGESFRIGHAKKPTILGMF